MFKFHESADAPKRPETFCGFFARHHSRTAHARTNIKTSRCLTPNSTDARDSLWPYNAQMLRCCIALWALGVASAAWAAPAPPLQDPAPIITQVESLLRARAEAYPGAAEITVEPPRLVNQAACDQLEAFLSGNTTLRSRMSVGVRCLAPQAWSLYVVANIRLIGHYYVSNRAIPAGQALSLDDLDTREGDLLRDKQAITDPAHIVGYITTRRIPPGGEIRSNALRDPQSVQRGQAVRTIARGVGFVASGEGQALEAGSPGMQIQVRSSSGQVITATVIDAHTVQVMM